MDEKLIKLIRMLTLFLAMCLGVVSYCGAFVPMTYEQETVSLATQGVGQDLVDLFLIVPLLVIMIFLIKPDRVLPLLFHGGLIFYVLYAFFIYSLGIRFNFLFLWYCTILGLSVYLFVLILGQLDAVEFKIQCAKGLRFWTVLFLWLVAVIFYLLWIKEILPAILSQSAPKSVVDYHLLVNPVHVMDLAVVLPGLVISAVLFAGKHRWGNILAPIALGLIVFMAIALAGMMFLLKIRHVEGDVVVAIIFAVLAFIGSLLLAALLRNVKQRNDDYRLNV